MGGPVVPRHGGVGARPARRQAGDDGDALLHHQPQEARRGDKPDAAMPADAVRSHWTTGNQQHHVLDTTMREDGCRIRKGHGPENFARLRRIALNQLRRVKVIRKGKERKLSLRLKRKKCGWDRNFLLSALLA